MTEATTFDAAALVNIIVGSVITLAGFFSALGLLFKYSKPFKTFLVSLLHSTCQNNGTMQVILGNSIIHRCEIAEINQSLPQDERDWLIKLMGEYEDVRHWNGVVKDRFERVKLLPLEPTVVNQRKRIDREAIHGRPST
jgi:hypothetical protein